MPNGYNTIIETIKTDNLQLFQSLVHGKSPFINKILQFFQLSCLYNSIKIFHYLLKLNPKMHIRDKDDLAFKLACKGENLQIMKILYEKNSNINIEKVLLDLFTKNNPFFNLKIIKFLIYKIEENKSVKKLPDVLHKICAKIIKAENYLDYLNYIAPNSVDNFLLNYIIDKYIHLLDIYELCKITIEYNQISLFRKFKLYLEDNKLTKLLKSYLQKISTSPKIPIEKIEITESLIYIYRNLIDDDEDEDLCECFKNSCEIGNKEFVEIILSRFIDRIDWMLVSVSLWANSYNHNRIVDCIFTYYPQLIKHVKDAKGRSLYNFYDDLYKYLISKVNMPIFNTVISPCDEKCPICLEQHETYIKTECGHIFGENCIKEWISYGNRNCPYCRTNLLQL